MSYERKEMHKAVALTAEKNAKYHSSPMVADQYTAESVTQREHPHEEVDFR